MVFDKQIFLNYRGYGVSEDSEGKRLPMIHFFLYKGPGPLPVPGFDQVCGIHMNLGGGYALRWSSTAPWLVQLLRALKRTALSSKGLERQSWLKSAPISQRGGRDVLNSSWPNTREGGAAAKPFVFTRKEECWFCRFLIMFSQPVLFPACFKMQSEKCTIPHQSTCPSTVPSTGGTEALFSLLTIPPGSQEENQRGARIPATAVQGREKKTKLRCGTPRHRT